MHGRRPGEGPPKSPAERAEVVIDAGLVAPHLGLSPAQFMVELKRGLVYQTTEQGAGERQWRYRITFRYRARECRILADPDGHAVVAS